MDAEREFGALLERVDALREVFEDWRRETRAAFEQLDSRLDHGLANHSQRIQRLERWQAWIMGIAAAIAAGFTLVIDWLRGR